MDVNGLLTAKFRNMPTPWEGLSWPKIMAELQLDIDNSKIMMGSDQHIKVDPSNSNQNKIMINGKHWGSPKEKSKNVKL